MQKVINSNNLDATKSREEEISKTLNDFTFKIFKSLAQGKGLYLIQDKLYTT